MTAIQTQCTHWEFVLLPAAPNRPPNDLKSVIKWRKSTSPYHTRDLCLGEGHGYVWFTHGTIFGQELVRDKLNLKGGDDRIQLAMDGLLVKDKGTMTANSCLHIPVKFGDRAIDYIEETIEKTIAKSPDADLWRVVGSLAYIRTDRSTELLLKLFNSNIENLRRAAEYALIHKPWRAAAKRAYIEMLERGRYVHQVCEACVKFDWKDALPQIHRVIASPQNLPEFRSAIYARRRLEGNPVPQELIDAGQTLHGLMRDQRDAELEEKLNAARRLLIESDDSEAANLTAVSLATFVAKANNTERVRQAGVEILKARPRKSTLDFLRSLAHGIDEKYRPQIVRIASIVEGS